MKKTQSAVILLMICLSIPMIWYFTPSLTNNTSRNAPGRSIVNNTVISDLPSVNVQDTPSVIVPKRFFRDSKAIDYSSLEFAAWDVEKASAKISSRRQKPYTIMIYMNGSDLESENGAATDDLIEMLESGVDSRTVNIVLFTGGTNRWQNNVIPENECAVWEISDGSLYKVTGVGLKNMGNPGTLSSFIDFSVMNFPAKRYGLILWDHGGGSIAGYGHDEKFNESRLSLLDMNYAFEESVLAGSPIEFLGFDSCLMGSVEMAVVASDYFKYMIASEDLEPGAGWDYSFLQVLNAKPDMDGAELGKAITDYFISYYGSNSDEDLTMSVIDLSVASTVMETMGDLMSLCSDALLSDRESSFKAFAVKRNMTKTFGVGSPRDNESDMVDIGNMAQNLSDIFPLESARVHNALSSAVVYTRHNSTTDLKGLSSYYIYGGKETARESLATYNSLSMDEYYTDYLYNFFSLLNSGNTNKTSRSINSDSQTGSRSSGVEISNTFDPASDALQTDITIWQPVDKEPGAYKMIGLKENYDSADGTGYSSAQSVNSVNNILWPQINGQNVCLYKISESDSRTLYAIPASVNGRDCDIIISISEERPDGKILGTRQEDGFIIQKGFDPIEAGDKISFYFQKIRFNPNSRNQSYKGEQNGKSADWVKTKEFTADSGLKIEWSVLDTDTSRLYCSLRHTDYQNNLHYTVAEEITS